MKKISLFILALGVANMNLYAANAGAGTSLEEQLKHAMYDRNVAEAGRLLALGAGDVYAVDGDGRTLLHVAADTGMDEVCTALIRRGALVNVVDRSSGTPLGYATRSATTTALLLEEGAQTDMAGAVPSLYAAASLGRTEGCQQLVAAGAVVNVVWADGYTPLHMAAVSNYDTTCEELLRAGADVSARNVAGDTALQLALKPFPGTRGKIDSVVVCLLAGGSSIL